MGEVKIHVIGIDPALEPLMVWDRLLVGPLTSFQRDVVKFFSLPETPFAGLKVSLVFSGDTSKHSPDAEEAIRQRQENLQPGYSEFHKAGVYHQVVKEVPDLAVVLNPGFAHYPTKWWPAMQRLRQLGVPIIATGYGDAFTTDR